MKGKRMIFAVILALVVCLVLIPTCAFADDEGNTPVPSTENPVVGVPGEGASGDEDSTVDPVDGVSSDPNANNDGEDVNDPKANNDGEDANDPKANNDGEDANNPNTNNDGEGSNDPNVDSDENVPALLGSAAPANVASTLQDQINIVGTTQTTITLDKDYNESITINDGQNITLDLNGHKLTNAPGDHTIFNKGTLTIIDSVGAGVVDNVSHGCAALVNAGTVNIEGGTFTRSKENGTSNENAGGNSWYTIKNLGIMTISGDVNVNQNGHFSSLIANGWQSTGKPQCGVPYNSHLVKLTINGGSFSGGINTIKNDEYGILEINGGTFSNVQDTVVMNWNVAVINGGSFSTDGDHVVTNGCYYMKNYPDAAKGELTINDGTFNAIDGGNGNLFGWSKDATQNKGTLTINGGSFTGNANSDDSGMTYDVIYNNGVFTDGNVKNLVGSNVAVISANGKTAVASSEDAASVKTIIDEAAKSGSTLVIDKLPMDVSVGNVPAGVTVVNNSGNTVTVNGVAVRSGESYTVPGAPTAEPLYVKYFVIEGKDAEWTKGSDAQLKFRLNSADLLKVLIDGVEVEFTVADDGTVTLASAVLEALDAGEHEITFVFADGSCSTHFTVK